MGFEDDVDRVLRERALAASAAAERSQRLLVEAAAIRDQFHAAGRDAVSVLQRQGQQPWRRIPCDNRILRGIVVGPATGPKVWPLRGHMMHTRASDEYGSESIGITADGHWGTLDKGLGPRYGRLHSSSAIRKLEDWAKAQNDQAEHMVYSYCKGNGLGGDYRSFTLWPHDSYADPSDLDVQLQDGVVHVYAGLAKGYLPLREFLATAIAETILTARSSDDPPAG